MKVSTKKYLPSFLVGLLGGLFLIFSPIFYAIFKPIGNLPQIIFALSDKIRMILSLPVGHYETFLLGFSYYLFTIPFFFIYELILWLIEKQRFRVFISNFVFTSFVFFSIGSILSFLIFFFLTIIATSQWRGPF